MNFWIKTTVYFCPVCCSEDRTRERMPLPKPENPSERYEWHEQYDWCEN